MVPSMKESTVVPVLKRKVNITPETKVSGKESGDTRRQRNETRLEYKDKLVRLDYKTQEVMFDDKLLKLTEREVIALGKSRAEEKTGSNSVPNRISVILFRKISGMKLFEQNLIWNQTVEEKHLGHIMVKLLFQKMGKKVKKIIIRSKLFSISNYFIEFSFYFEVLKHIVMNI